MSCRTSAARLLGVAPNASARQVQSAFRKKALETHPDRGGCANQFLAVRDAADLLLRPAPAATAPTSPPEYEAVFPAAAESSEAVAVAPEIQCWISAANVVVPVADVVLRYHLRKRHSLHSGI